MADENLLMQGPQMADDNLLMPVNSFGRNEAQDIKTTCVSAYKAVAAMGEGAAQSKNMLKQCDPS